MRKWKSSTVCRRVWVPRSRELTSALLTVLLPACDARSKCDKVVERELVRCHDNEALASLDAALDGSFTSDRDLVGRSDAAAPWPELGYDFVLVNATAAPVYVQEHEFSGGSHAFLQLRRGAEPLQFQGSCAVCRCDACRDCAVCGRSSARVRRIEPGATYSAHWVGNLWEQVAASCGALSLCERPIGVPTEPLTAVVTFSDAFDLTTEFGSNDEFVREPTRSVSVQFDYVDGARSTIELR